MKIDILCNQLLSMSGSAKPRYTIRTTADLWGLVVVAAKLCRISTWFFIQLALTDFSRRIIDNPPSATEVAFMRAVQFQFKEETAAAGITLDTVSDSDKAYMRLKTKNGKGKGARQR